MKVARIEISNILGIKELQFEPGKITEITGKNASGKTSTLTAIRAALQGGNQAELLRNGAEQGEIVIVLDSGIKIQKTITAEATEVKMTHPEHGKVSSPAKMIAGLADALSVNPVDFLTAEPKKRVDVLLEAMPLRIAPETIQEMVGHFSFIEMGSIKPEDHALKVLDTAHKAAFQRRQDVNRAAKEKRNTVEQLGTGIERPKEPIENIKQKMKTIETEFDQLQKTKTEKVCQINNEMHKALSDLAAWYEQKRVETKKLFEGRAAELSSMDVEIQKKREEGREIERQLESFVKAQGAIEAVDRMQAEAEKLEKNSATLTECIERINQTKQNLLKDLPIKGIEIREGKVFVDGVDFEHVNTARRVQIAVQIAQIRAKQLGLICVDNMEALDAESFAALEAELQKTDLQLITTRVSDSEFQVVTK